MGVVSSSIVDEQAAADDDDEIVLSWWQNPVNIAVIAVTAALLGAILGWSFGRSSAQEEGNEVDVGFLQDMRVHHEQAVAMGQLYLDVPDAAPELRAVTRSIVEGQALEIGRMIQQLRALGAPEAADLGEPAMTWMGMSSTFDDMPGIASAEEIDELAGAEGTAADQLFVELMVRHHEGGIHMADYAAEHAAVEEVRIMAAAMAEAQHHEITELEGLVD